MLSHAQPQAFISSSKVISCISMTVAGRILLGILPDCRYVDRCFFQVDAFTAVCGAILDKSEKAKACVGKIEAGEV